MASLQIEIFLLLLTGYIMGKKGMLNKSTRDQLTDMVVYIILPCSILKSFQMELSKEILMATAQVLAAAFAVQALYWILNKVLLLQSRCMVPQAFYMHRFLYCPSAFLCGPMGCPCTHK